MNYHSHVDEFGILSATIQLEESVNEPVTVISLASFNEVMSIDKDGLCFFDIATV